MDVLDSRPMSGFRAKDADRDRYVDILESAYVDGQLGEQDRELRVSRALTAETLDELDALTRDLQNQPAPVVVHRPGPTVVAPSPAPTPRPVPPTRPVPWPVTPKDKTPQRVVGLVGAAILAVVVFSMASVDPPLPELDYSTVPADQGGSASELGYEMAAPGVRRFIRRYEAKFGTTEAHEVSIFADRVDVHVPVGGSVERSEQWSWDGDWRREADAQVVDRPTGPVDLRALDVRALFDNIEVATSDLGVADAELQRVVVRQTPDGKGSVTIHVRNGSTDSAVLETTSQGSRVRAVPHDG